MNRQLYQIVETGEKANHAGTKATGDVACIAQKLGLSTISIRKKEYGNHFIGKIIRQIYYWKDWNTAYKTIPDGSIVLLQHPFHHKQLTRENILKKLKQKKRVRYIALVHDVEELREYRDNEYYRSEFQSMIERSDQLIVHNEKMKEWFIQQGIPEQKLITLGIFDYLTDQSYEPQHAQFSQDVMIAGNLDQTRSGYLADLGKINDIQFNVYGPNPDETLLRTPNIHYGGSLSPETLPQRLNKGFGLVWDGHSINGCEGPAGRYLQYNNPHKLSLYLASGLPVIIWKGAAKANMVQKEMIGIVVNSLYDIQHAINHISQNEYREMQENVSQIGSQLRKGEFTTAALEKAIAILKQTWEKKQ